MKKLKDHYSDHSCFAKIKGRRNVFKNMANYIINGKQHEKDK